MPQRRALATAGVSKHHRAPLAGQGNQRWIAAHCRSGMCSGCLTRQSAVSLVRSLGVKSEQTCFHRLSTLPPYLVCTSEGRAIRPVWLHDKINTEQPVRRRETRKWPKRGPNRRIRGRSRIRSSVSRTVSLVFRYSPIKVTWLFSASHIQGRQNLESDNCVFVQVGIGRYTCLRPQRQTPCPPWYQSLWYQSMALIFHQGTSSQN